VSGPLAYGVPLRIQEVKASGDAWEVSGYASTWGNVDLGGDVVLKGAFSASLASGEPVRFLYAHDQRQVLGVPLALKEDDTGLFGRFRIANTQLGQEIHTLLRTQGMGGQKALDAFSIGYLPRDFEYDDSGVRKLREVELLEISVVAMPMNPMATVTGVKAADYASLSLDAIVQTLTEHRASALAAAKALAERRRSEGRKLSDRVVELLEALRAASLDDADALLALLTAPPPERAEKAQPEPVREDAPPTPPTAEAKADATDAPDPTPDPVAVRTADSLVEAHLRRARLNALRRKYADVSLPEVDPLARLERLPAHAWLGDAAS
jgi:HK97 family phage prohead protease